MVSTPTSPKDATLSSHKPFQEVSVGPDRPFHYPTSPRPAAGSCEEVDPSEDSFPPHVLFLFQAVPIVVQLKGVECLRSKDRTFVAVCHDLKRSSTRRVRTMTTGVKFIRKKKRTKQSVELN